MKSSLTPSRSRPWNIARFMNPDRCMNWFAASTS